MPCSWALKGLVMRVLTERLAGREVDLSDGIKVFDNGAWGMVRPDPVEPLVHVTVETPDRRLPERPRAGAPVSS